MTLSGSYRYDRSISSYARRGAPSVAVPKDVISRAPPAPSVGAGIPDWSQSRPQSALDMLCPEGIDRTADPLSRVMPGRDRLLGPGKQGEIHPDTYMCVRIWQAVGRRLDRTRGEALAGCWLRGRLVPPRGDCPRRPVSHDRSRGKAITGSVRCGCDMHSSGTSASLDKSISAGNARAVAAASRREQRSPTA
jgi:hypothetical protein